jgi:alkane 1-monooxygenase
MHRRSPIDRALAEVMMTVISYPHFCVEHVYGHHRKVATREDAASSRFGETLYGFLPRTLWTSLRSFWEIETAIAKRKGLSLGSPRDRRVRYPASVAAMYGATYAVGGWASVIALAVIGAVAILVLETINYLEHYGLARARTKSGGYERVQPHHSWNSAHGLSSRFLFGLTRHADHHYLSSRPYAILRHHPDAPQLPHGYGAMFLIALVPPWWRRVMDPRVLALRPSEQPGPRPSPATTSTA